ncbi:MAG: S-layer homology domain-containing protein [Clostridiales bacterium]|nr:S-layer homology domain-containing protein [Clostridiales bacterium]
MKRRIAALFLALAMFCLTPLSACAADSQTAISPESRSAQSEEHTNVFTDVPADARYADAIQYCYQAGLISGTSATTFSPESSLTRAQLAVVLHRMAKVPVGSGTSAFSDVPDGMWYSAAVTWVAEQGFFHGYGDGRFGPNDPVTREQLSIVLERYGGTDAGAGVNLAAPKEYASRAEVATALYTYLSQAEHGTGSRILVAYFSATGTTRGVAERIADATGGDLYEIVPEIPYTTADLDYTDDSCRANREQKDSAVRPAISGSTEDLGQYDVVFLGYPIWQGQPPRIVSTFLESGNFDGKTIVPFCTSGGSGFSSSGLPELTAGASWLEGQRFSSFAAQEDIEKWIEGLDLLETAKEAPQLTVSFQGHSYTATLARNSTVDAFVQHIRDSGGSITLAASDYGSFEKSAALGTDLPANNTQTTTEPGDFVLYNGSQIVLFYGTNSWSYTRLGKLDGDLTDLKAHLGEGDVEITFTLLP